MDDLNWGLYETDWSAHKAEVLERNADIIIKALDLFDKVESGGVDLRSIPELQTLNDDEFAFISVSYILIERR